MASNWLSLGVRRRISLAIRAVRSEPASALPPHQRITWR